MTEMIERAVEMPPLKEQSAEEQIMRALERAVYDRGRDYVYDSQGGSCTYLESIEERNRNIGYWTVDQDGIRDEYILEAPVEKLQTSCIIGAAVVSMGIPMIEIAPYNEMSAHDLMLELLPLRSLINQVSNEFKEGLIQLQRHQDEEMPWGEALDEFKLYVGWPKENAA